MAVDAAAATDALFLCLRVGLGDAACGVVTGSTLRRSIMGVIDSGDGEETGACLDAVHDSDGDEGIEGVS